MDIFVLYNNILKVVYTLTCVVNLHESDSINIVYYMTCACDMCMTVQHPWIVLFSQGLRLNWNLLWKRGWVHFRLLLLPLTWKCGVRCLLWRRQRRWKDTPLVQWEACEGVSSCQRFKQRHCYNQAKVHIETTETNPLLLWNSSKKHAAAPQQLN